MIAVPPVKRYAQAASRHPDARRKSRSKGRFAARRNELKAASLGYEIDRRESWRGSTVLRRGADKIVVKRNGNGHYVFFSVREDNERDDSYLPTVQDLADGGLKPIAAVPGLAVFRAKRAGDLGCCDSGCGQR
jgi:hypothetical protein